MSLSQMSGGKNTDKFIHGLVINRALNNLNICIDTLKRTICRLLDMVVALRTMGADRSLSSFLTTATNCHPIKLQCYCRLLWLLQNCHVTTSIADGKFRVESEVF